MLPALATFLAGLHTLGAALGAGGALYAEIFYAKAMADGKFDISEKEWFSITFKTLTWGMLTVLVTGAALMVVQYFLPASPQDVLYAPLWMQNVLAFVITFTAWLMSRGSIRWWLGSSLIFAGWWTMLGLDSWRTVSVPFLTLVFSYILLVFISAAFWKYLAILMRKQRRHA